MNFSFSVKVLLLLLVCIIEVDGSTSSSNVSQESVSTDSCDYEYPGGREVRCGDQCIDKNARCLCGSDAFRPYITAEQCCIASSQTCTREFGDTINPSTLRPTDDAICSTGLKLSMSTKCPASTRELECYNPYEDSKEIGFRSHYSCPRTCVSLNLEMCRGVNWCNSDIQQCGPSLRCRTDAARRLVNSSLVNEHWYCANWNSDDDIYKTKVRNNGNFDTIDRSDEETSSTEGTSYDIDHTAFRSCTQFSSPGLKCGSDCKFNRFWCNEGATFTCGEDQISNTDHRLCGNPLVFRDMKCISYFPGPPGRAGVRWYGKKCTGTNQQCVVPWYTQGSTRKGEGILSERCPDKSDQMFDVGLTCRQHLQQYIEFHDYHFCDIPYYHPSSKHAELICKNKTKWFEQQGSTFMDPHDCQSSCSASSRSLGLDCTACTNPSYFSCTSANKCLHPQLVCDGHPQCPGGEDEQLDKCHIKYRLNKVIEPYSSFRCTSTLYENLEIYATPCNNKVECANGQDEAECGDNKTSKTVLIVSTMTIWIGFVIVRIVRRVCSKKATSEDNLGVRIPLTIEQLLEKYQNKIQDSEIVKEVNLHLHHANHTKTVEQTNKEFLLIFDFLASQHNFEEAEMYFYLHKHLDPNLVQKMIGVKYPSRHQR